MHKVDAKESFLGTMQGLVPNANIHRNYVYYLLKYLNLGASFNGATVPHIYFKDYGNKEINQIAFTDQVKISDYLSKLEIEISLLKNKLVYLDELVKSRFIEMFGKCEKTNLSNIAKITMGQSPDSKSYKDEGNGIPFFQGKGDYGEKYTIVSHWTTQPTKKAYTGDVLMSVRAPVGPVNISSCDCCIGRALCSINAIECKTNNEFIYCALNAIQDEIADRGTGSTFKAINKTDVYEIQMPVAEVSKQNEFANFVKQIDKLKFVCYSK